MSYVDRFGSTLGQKVRIRILRSSTKRRGRRTQMYGLTPIRYGSPSAYPIEDSLTNSCQAFVERVAEEYGCMEDDNVCEAQFAMYAMVNLFHQDKLSSRRQRDQRGWKSDSKVQLVAKAGVRWWEAPPVLTTAQDLKQYDFDIRPDGAYWLSLDSFNPTYVSQIYIWAFVIKLRITSPYLFIEFKKDEKDITCAENQVAAVASLALYNRYMLRVTCLKQAKKAPKDDFHRNLAVYGITFQGTFYKVWCLRPTLNATNAQWGGCTMTSVHQGFGSIETDVKDLADWINEIHRWGLGVHGPLCENDIKTCLAAHSGGSRVSDVNENLH